MAKITLSMAKKFAADDFNKFTHQHRFLDEAESPLPFDNLDTNIVVADALFTDWPEADAIIGNPPFQSKNKMQEEFGPAYLQQLRAAYPGYLGLRRLLRLLVPEGARRAPRRRAGRARRHEHDPAELLARRRARLHRPERRDDRGGRRDACRGRARRRSTSRS